MKIGRRIRWMRYFSACKSLLDGLTFFILFLNEF